MKGISSLRANRFCVRFYFLILFVLFSLYSQAQGENELLKRLTPSSPEAASLIKAFNYPANHAYGLINISVPIYTVEAGGVSMPINISYHASGLKVHDNIGLAGLGWTLNAEPMITRSIKGAPDELSFLNNSQLGSNEPHYLENVLNAVLDEEPDEFYFNLAGDNGKFYFSRKPGVSGYTIETVPYKPYRIEFLGNFKFKITDDNGVQYFFGTDVLGNRAIEYTQGSGFVSSWKCTEIIASNLKDTLHFSYHPDRIMNMYYPTSQTVSILDDARLPGLWGVFSDLTPSCSGEPIYVPIYQLAMPRVAIDTMGAKRMLIYNNNQGSFSVSPEFLAGGDWMSEIVIVKHLKEILFRGGKVTFSVDPDVISTVSTVAVNSISVFNSDGEEVRRAHFNYDYFTTHTDPGPVRAGESWESRRYLSSMRFIGLHGDGDLSYSFEYNPVNLPGRATKQLDLWGYYNNAYMNQNLIQPFSLTTKMHTPSLLGGGNEGPVINMGNADRNSNEVAMQANILKKIIYPTGGYTSFEYEGNKAINRVTNEIRVVGGLRIKSKTDSDPVTGKSIKTTYKYGIDQNGAGYIKHWPFSDAGYDLFLTERIDVYHNPIKITPHLYLNCVEAVQIIGPPATVRNRTIYSNALVDISYSGAGTVGYPEVLELVGDPVDNSKHYWTRYKFYFAPLGSTGGTETPLFIPGTDIPYDRKFEWRYGTLLNKLYSKYEGATFYAMEERKRHQTNVFPNTIWSRSIYPRRFAIGERDALIFQHWDFLTLVNEYTTGYNQLLADTTVELGEYGPNFEFTRGYEYANPNVIIPTKVTMRTSDGEIKEETTRFPHDMLLPGVNLSAPNLAAVNAMISRNMVSVPVELEKREGAVSMAKTRNNFLAEVQSGRIVPENIEEYLRGAATPSRKGLIKKTDEYGNVLEQQMEGDVPVSYQWGYKSNYVIAEVQNATWNEIYFDSFEEEGTWDAVVYDDVRSFGGRRSAKISRSGQGESKGHSNLWLNVANNVSKKYKFSVWYYSDGPQASLSLFMKTANETQPYTYIHSIVSGVQDKWTLLEGVYEVPASITRLNLRLENSGVGNIWFDDVRLCPVDAEMVTYTYAPLVGLTSSCDANNVISHFEYDGHGRLSIVRDHKNDVVRRICYSYTGQSAPCAVVGNAEVSQVFQRQNCGAGFLGANYTYTVPANRFFGSTLQEANQRAQEDIQQNGQAQANLHGTCAQVFSSADVSGYYYKNNCPSGTPEGIYVHMPAGSYQSLISQTDADAQAVQAAQIYANTNGACISQNFQLTVRNTSSTGFLILMTDLAANQQYYYTVNSGVSTPTVVGQLPSGNYYVQLVPYIYGINFVYNIGCTVNGAGNQAVSHLSIPMNETCNAITIQY